MSLKKHYHLISATLHVSVTTASEEDPNKTETATFERNQNTLLATTTRGLRQHDLTRAQEAIVATLMNQAVSEGADPHSMSFPHIFLHGIFYLGQWTEQEFHSRPDSLGLN